MSGTVKKTGVPTVSADIRFGLLAPRLVVMGYQPIPLYPGDKRPAVNEWTDYHFDHTNRDSRSCLIRRGNNIEFPDFETGIVTGKTVALDVDVRDPGIAKTLKKLAEKILGPAPVRVGMPPKFLAVYRADTSFSKIRSKNFILRGDKPKTKGYKHHAVEVLARGQQFAAFGIHQRTKKPYRWSVPGGLLAVPFSELTLVSEAQCAEYVAMAEKAMLKAGAKVHSGVGESKGTHTSGSNGKDKVSSTSDPDLCRQALAAIPNGDEEYEVWWRVGLATATALGELGRRDFIAWSAKSAKHDTDSSGEAIPGYTDRAYTRFLKYCAQGKAQITAGTIFHMAYESGWHPPDRRVAIQRMWRHAFRNDTVRS